MAREVADVQTRRLVARAATAGDAPLLGRLNRQLIEEEGHRNPMTVPELTERMRGLLATEYEAVLFEVDGAPVAYALYRDDGDAVYLRQFFVDRSRRRAGIGRRAMRTLLDDVLPPGKRVTLEVLTGNARGRAFWRALGFREYAVTLELERPTPSAVAPPADDPVGER
jgi:GNAT superfamily N-acetyltransferase